MEKKKNGILRGMVWLLLCAAVVGLDQLTKWLIVRSFTLGQTKALLPDILHLTYVRNTGAAFGMLKDQRWLFLVISTVAVCGMLFLLWWFRDRHSLFCSALLLIAGGGIGNMIDRIRLGYVIDFIDFRAINFAVFNAADSCVCIGCALLLVYIFFVDGKSKRPLFADRKKASTTETSGVDNSK